MKLERLSASVVMGEAGTFTAIASCRSSVAHGANGPTRFAAGAFRESLGRSIKYPLLWQHRDDSPVGIVMLKESTEGLMADGTLAMDVERAKEARSLMQMGALSGVSIGFTAEKVRQEKHDGKPVRVVEKANLLEVSLVTFPADDNARVLTVHSEGEAEDTELELAVDSIERLAGRAFSEANLGKIRSALGALVDLVEKVDPGHIVALGRRAAKSSKKSYVVCNDPKPARRMRAAQASARVRRMEALAVGVDIPVGDLPLLDIAPYPAMEPPNPDYALRRAIDGALSFPEDARRPLLVAIAKQYLVATGEAEEVAGYDLSDGDRETPVNDETKESAA